MTRTASLLASLVGINSVNPSLIPGAAGEPEIARFLKRWLDERGIQTEMHDAAPNRPSVIARVPGKGGGPSLLLNAHLDTVGIDGMPDPFNARIEDGRLYGRGAYDMKGGLAACMLALADIRPGELAGDVFLAAVADEEHASLGIRGVLPRIRVEAAM
jgi:acetylornithine deacetylase